VVRKLAFYFSWPFFLQVNCTCYANSSFIDFRYLRPKLNTSQSLIRGLYPTFLLFFYTILIWLILIGLIGFQGIYAIGSVTQLPPSGFQIIIVLTLTSSVFAILLQSLWDKETVLRRI